MPTRGRGSGKMAMQIGVLMIGSLYWDSTPRRRTWRRDHLDFDRQQKTRVPIRYGRRSTRRGDTYTMVFSSGLREEQFGTAIAVPFKSEDLVEEAEHLWAAEALSESGPNRSISARWGCVAVLEHPQVRLPCHLRKQWIARVQRKPHHGNLSHAHDEAAAVNRSGFLNICWPKTEDGSLLEMDALLATVTNPSLDSSGRYPAPEKIADAWNTSDCQKAVKYFWNNGAHGITTFQDAEIEAQLREIEHKPE